MIENLNTLYIPTNDRQLRRIQRQGEELDANVRSWAARVIDVLPPALPTNADETYILSLFLAQQRRKNILLDAYIPPPSNIWYNIRQAMPFAPRQPDREELEAIHRNVATQLDSDIERAVTYYCSDSNIPPESEPAIDWRVAIRFMCQSIYSRVANVDLAKITNHPRRFELALVARELATEIAEKRQQMFSAFGIAA